MEGPPARHGASAFRFGGAPVNKRILDGGGLWKSDKLARMQPEWMRAEYANWIPLALANGVFEADTRRIWAMAYSYNRPDISFDDAEDIKRELCRVGLLFLWFDDGTGKVWGYFTGIEKPGRLPSKSRLDKKHEPIGPTPAPDAFRSYIELTRSKPLNAALVSQWLPRLWVWYWFWSWFWKGIACFARSVAFGAGCVSRCARLLERQPRNSPEALKLTKGRVAKIAARVKADPGFFETLKRAVLKARQTPFCCGAGSRGWRANFDWFITNDTNCVAVLEGKYDGAKGDGIGKLTGTDLALKNARELGLTN
jgi:hypothetical protein